MMTRLSTSAVIDMGYSTDHRGIRSFVPDDDENTLHIQQSSNLGDLIERIKEHFGQDSKLEDFSITADYIHTDCLGYDLFDRSDWTNYLIIERN